MKKLTLVLFSLFTFLLVISRASEGSLFSSSGQALAQAENSRCVKRSQIYSSPVGNAFGPCVVHEPGWDRYVMYLSINSTVKDGYPSLSTPGDPGTYNDRCDTWHADRIWYTWHFGDSMTPSGWDEDDGHGNIPPILALGIGGDGESALIGDPSVVFWQGAWHMYYEGTDRCDGLDNRIFHATSDSLFGPWIKQGEVEGLVGNLGGSGLSWPSTFVEDGNLYLYYTDGSVRLYSARAIDSAGHSFEMENDGAPVIPELVNEGSVSKYKDRYRLAYDLFQGKAIKITESDSKFSFPPGRDVILPAGSGWDGTRVGLPFYLSKEKTDGLHDRIYYGGWSDYPSVGVCVLPKTGDLDYDDNVGMRDTKILLSRYGTDDTETDLDGDGLVNGMDFGEISKLVEKK